MEFFKYYREVDEDSALFYATIASQFALRNTDSLLMVKSLNAKGYLLKARGDYERAINDYEEALDIAMKQGYSDQIKYLLNNLAVVYTFFGKYDKSLEYHFKSLKIREDEGDELEVSVALNNIGLVYYKIGDNEKALQYFQRSYALKEKQDINYDVERNLINIGLAYIGLEQNENAQEIFLKLIDWCGGECESQIEVEAYSGLGVTMFNEEEYDESLKAFDKCLTLAMTEQNYIYEIISFYYLSRIYIIQNSFNKALPLLDSANSLVVKTDAQEWKMQISDVYSDFYYKTGDFKKAYDYQRKFINLKDSLLDEEVIQNLADIQIEYQERENLETISMQQSQISRGTSLLLLSSIIIFLALVILVILYRNNFHRKKVNEKLSEANRIIESQNHQLTDINMQLEEKVRDRTKELKDSNAALLKSNHELDNFIYKTSHDIRGPLATLQGICNVALIDIKDTKAVDYFKKLGGTAKKLNEILSKLLIINQINNSLVSEERVDFHSLIEQVVAKQKKNASGKKVKIIKEIEANLYFKSDVELLKIILNNLIGNAFKFYNTSGRIDSFVHITINKRRSDGVEIRVIDNGIGIEEEASMKIFEIFSKASEMGDSAGLGLYLVKLAVEKLEGHISLKRTEEGFTCFTVRF
ncbi:ATP-binding protein [Fulvivirga sediminis]|uniref:histidine kinase n=1 Tax=Fulvivirga sediminis TaxID=2803949 RepID=A0A937FCJ8_9BACT|nr:tetratricopeptide repeat-containing sensor histidine kinase [Fulvivirga sediminis]MBL3657933.1 tetratricopeptide repeat-containing sensor histidine kinase [Fulvivirga sediminis]